MLNAVVESCDKTGKGETLCCELEAAALAGPTSCCAIVGSNGGFGCNKCSRLLSESVESDVRGGNEAAEAVSSTSIWSSEAGPGPARSAYKDEGEYSEGALISRPLRRGAASSM
jgi:hypothetical protein